MGLIYAVRYDLAKSTSAMEGNGRENVRGWP